MKYTLPGWFQRFFVLLKNSSGSCPSWRNTQLRDLPPQHTTSSPHAHRPPTGFHHNDDASTCPSKLHTRQQEPTQRPFKHRKMNACMRHRPITLGREAHAVLLYTCQAVQTTRLISDIFISNHWRGMATQLRHQSASRTCTRAPHACDPSTCNALQT